MDLLSLPSPLWVLGTGTGVGKTHAARMIAQAWAELGPVVYRKPIQTGVDSAADPEADACVVQGPKITVETGVVFRAPLSPLAAAEAEGRDLDLADLARWTCRPVPAGTRLILESAGGVMVPYAPSVHFLAWASDFRIPAVVIAPGGLGTLNHTLLTCEALMIRGWEIASVLLNPGVDQSFDAVDANAAILRRFLPLPVHIL